MGSIFSEGLCVYCAVLQRCDILHTKWLVGLENATFIFHKL